MRLHEFLTLIIDRNCLIDFLTESKVLTNNFKCKNCECDIYMNPTTLTFKCTKSRYIVNPHKKRIRVVCGFKRSARKDTWFNRSKISIENICRFVAYFLMLRPPRQEFLINELGLTTHTIAEWQHFCRKVCVYWIEKHSQKIGGTDAIVEIDEAQIGRKKYNRGQLIDQKWIFAGYERGSSRMFMVPVPERSKECLLSIIKEWILPGTTIVSDCWKTYDCLKDDDFVHYALNHSLSFVDPDLDEYTQDTGKFWREVRPNITRCNTRNIYLVGCLAEFQFKRKFGMNERITEFFKIVGELYPCATE